METLIYYGVLISTLLVLSRVITRKKQLKKLPPGPFSFPVVGHLHLLMKPLHESLLELANKYGPVLSLRFGSRRVVLVSNVSAIEECLKKNDIVFANRPVLPSRMVFSYDINNAGSLPYGAHWRDLRRLFTLEVLSSRRVQLSSDIRVEEIRFLAKQLFKSSFEGDRKVNMKTFFYLYTCNMMFKIFAGTRFIDEGLDSPDAESKLVELRKTFGLEGLTSTLGDFIPFLRWMPFNASERTIRKRYTERDRFMQGLIDARRNAKSSLDTDGASKRTMIDVFLSLQESEPDYYTDDLIKGYVALLVVGGAATSARTMELIFSRLLSHPEVLKKAREEIDANVGHSRLIEDSDLSKLQYIQCIINETLRCGTLGGILPPHEASEDCTVGGYHIPKGTMLLVNALSLHRDPNLWQEPEIFKPERFQAFAEEEKGGLKFVPFGWGRRQCPGIALAMRLMALVIATLIQCFDWEDCSQDAIKAKDTPVEAIFRPRQELVTALSQL